MAKRVQATSQFELEKCNKRQKYSKDEISKLPDDILVSILSLLTMKDAAKSSVISHRWRYLWTFITSSLEFDDYKKVRAMPSDNQLKAIEAERPRFVDWVNQVLKLHQAPTLDGLKILFDMDAYSFKRDINDWLKFAIEKRVKWLELDFTCFWRSQIMKFLALDFTCFWRWSLRRNYALPPQLFGNSQFGSLTSLHLTCVDVTGKALVYFFSNCPFLENLSVATSNSLVYLKISCPLLKLKRLEILRCFNLKKMEIAAMNLVSFTYSGPKISMLFKDVPRLREVSFQGYYASFLVKKSRQLSSYFSQLETLKLNFSIEPFVSFPEFPKLSNLKHLELALNANRCQSLLRCISILEASPLLNKLVLKLTNLDASIQEMAKVSKSKLPHQCLKVVELVGFVGCTIDVELALYLLTNSVSLEKIIIDPRHPYAVKSRPVRDDPKKKLAIQARARPIQRRLPPGVKLMIHYREDYLQW